METSEGPGSKPTQTRPKAQAAAKAALRGVRSLPSPTHIHLF